MKKLFWLLAFVCALVRPAQAQFSNQRAYVGSSSGSANAQVLAIPNYQRNVGVSLYALLSFSNTGALTLNVNGTGVTPVKKVTSSGLQALSGGEVVAGQVSQFIFDGSFYELFTVGSSAFGTQQSVASATTTNLGGALSNAILVTGTTTIASFGSSASLGNPYYLVQFQSSLTLTQNPTSLIIPGAANLVVQANDTILAQFLGGSNWRVVNYSPAANCANPLPASATTAGDISTFAGTTGCLQDSTANIAAGVLTGISSVRGLPVPQTTVYTSSSGTYTTPAHALYLEVEMCGAGGGGDGSGATEGVGGAGGNTTFGAGLTAQGGAATPTNIATLYPSPATASGGDVNIPGALGTAANVMNSGGFGDGLVSRGAASLLGQGGNPGTVNAAATAIPAVAASGFCAGGGGGGFGANANYNSGWGGNAGAYLKKLIASPAATYAYGVGAAGAGGTLGTNGAAGSAGSGGYIRVVAYFQ